jgi:hypothetical protein
MIQVENRGWKHCTLLESDGLRFIVTNDVGPRIIECSLEGGRNLFKEFQDQLGVIEGDRYMLFGGHRLWLAPESHPRSYAPDFGPVQVQPLSRGARFVQREEPENRITKSIDVEFLDRRRAKITHAVLNGNPWAIKLAPWAMTLMAAGTRAIVPQEPYLPHPEYLDPARTLTLWSYTRMDDPRVKWGSRFIQLREDSSVAHKFKLGIQNRQRWIACWVHGWLVIRTFGFDPRSRYADSGCNCEIFTMPGFLEVETLGPLQLLQPGQHARHEEIWHFWRLEDLPAGEDALEEVLSDYLAQLAYPGEPL